MPTRTILLVGFLACIEVSSQTLDIITYKPGSYKCDHYTKDENPHIYFIDPDTNSPIDSPALDPNWIVKKLDDFDEEFTGIQTFAVTLDYQRDFPLFPPPCRYLQWDSQNLTYETTNFTRPRGAPTISPTFLSVASGQKLEFVCEAAKQEGDSVLNWIVYDDYEQFKQVGDPSSFNISASGKDASRLEILVTSGDAMFVTCSQVREGKMLYSDLAVLCVVDESAVRRHWGMIVLSVLGALFVLGGVIVLWRWWVKRNYARF